MADFDSLVDDSQQAQPNTVSSKPGLMPGFDELQDDSDKYGTLGQMAKTAAEGVGEGLLGPLFTAGERAAGIQSEDILAREKENPIIKGTAKVAGLGTGLLTGTGEAAAMTKAGEIAAEAAGLGKAAGAMSFGHKVGSAAVQQAAEMAVLQGGDEASKMILQDPEASAESAIANVGMAAALGGAGGAFITGAVSPLWKATAGPKVEGILSSLKSHLNGTAAILPEQIEAALSHLGIDAAPEIRAVLSGNPTAIEKFNVLKEVQNKPIMDALDKLNNDSSESVMSKLGVHPSEVEVYSENEAGHKLLDSFKKEFEEKYEPIASALDKRNAEAINIPISDNSRLDAYGRILEEGMTKVGTDSPAYKIYNEYGNRLLAKDTVGGLDMLKTEIGNNMTAAKRAGDFNTLNALRDVKSAISNLQDNQIERLAMDSEKLDMKGAVKAGQDVVAERAAANASYRDFAKMSDELTNHLGIGDFKGAGSLTSKLTDKISPEELLKKFSIRNNADLAQFLSTHFPGTLKEIQANELKKFLKPAVLGAKGEAPLNIKKLSDIISKAMAGQKEYVNSIISPGAMRAIESARTLQDAIPSPKSSGTAGWMSRVYSKMPASALAGVAMITSHNPVIGYLTGEMAHTLGRQVPDAINLAYLKFLGSNQPIKSEAFKAMVDMFHNTAKGEMLIAKGVGNVFSSTGRVLTTSQMPAKADLIKLDKLIAKNQKEPSNIYANQDGHVGHYLPDHHASLTEVSTRAMGYLQSTKPQPYQSGPLDKPLEPSKADMARYNRALEIAQQPAVVLQHIKDGTITQNDMKDLGAMYPSLYKRIATKLSEEMTTKHSEERPISYKTRMGLSLFLGQAVDTSMSPQSIQAAQATYAPKQSTMPQDAQKSKKSTSTLGKHNKDYRTPIQASEAQDSERK